MTYAQTTSVPVDRSKSELERIFLRYGADQYVTGTDVAQLKTLIKFRYARRYFQITINLPDPDKFAVTESGRSRLREQQVKAWEQATRQRWRALVLYVKATLEATEAGIITFESAFLGNTLLPNGSTLYEYVTPQIQSTYETGEMPKLLTGF